MDKIAKKINKHETMISRERVIKAVNHEIPDRIPIDMGFHYSTGISSFAYHNLREHLGMPTDNIEIIDMFQFLARVDEDILKRFHCDCILLNPGVMKKHRWNPRGRYNFHIPQSVNPILQDNGSWVVGKDGKSMRMPEGGFFFDGQAFEISDENEDQLIQKYSKEAERIFKDSDFYTMYIGYHAYFKCADIDWQCRMLTDPDDILAENERIHERQIGQVKNVIDSMGGYIQAIAINSDLGSQHGPLCRPSLYEELCAPYVKKFCDFVHQNSDLKIFIHCCGSVRSFLPTLIQCGIDIINPVQISAVGMDPAELKREFGDKLVFWGGGCDTQKVLNNGSSEDVRENVKTLMNIFKPGGGFVFNQVHNIMGDIKPENIITMFDTAYDESFY